MPDSLAFGSSYWLMMPNLSSHHRKVQDFRGFFHSLKLETSKRVGAFLFYVFVIPHHTDFVSYLLTLLLNELPVVLGKKGLGFGFS